GEDLVESHVVVVHAVARRAADHRRTHTEIADQGRHCDVHHVVAEAPAVGPATRNEAAVGKGILHRALEQVVAEDAQARETGIIRIGRVSRSTAREAAFARGQIHFDKVGNKNACDVRTASFNRGQGAAEHNGIDQPGQLRAFSIFSEQNIVLLRTGAAVKVLVRKGDQTFVRSEERRVGKEGTYL